MIIQLSIKPELTYHQNRFAISIDVHVRDSCGLGLVFSEHSGFGKMLDAHHADIVIVKAAIEKKRVIS